MKREKKAKPVTIGVRLEQEIYDAVVQLAPEGNISIWIRELIRREIESNKPSE